MMAITAAVVLIGTLLVGVYYYFKWAFQYWEKKNIPYEKPKTPLGSILSRFTGKESPGAMFRRRYALAKKAGYKDYGLFTLWKPVYMAVDLEVIKHILTIDFPVFMDRGHYYNKKSDPLSATLFSIEGQEWRNLRAKLTPTFTSGKMKMMLQTVAECGSQLKAAMDRLASLNEPIDLRELSGQFTMNVIGSCAFGLDCNSFEDPNSDFLQYSKQVFQIKYKNLIKFILTMLAPGLCHKVGLTVIDENVSNFFLKIVKDTVEYREKNNVDRNDFMQLLIQLKNERSSDGSSQFSIEEIAAQAFIFFLAGFETSSSTMTFFLYELAINSDVQDKVREEISAVLKKHQGKVTYEAIMELKYMKQAIDETLRKYPPLPVLFRKTCRDYKLPGRDAVLEKGTMVFIPSLGLHYDPEYYPDPEKFDPERFSDENKGNINSYTYLPFGEGPRNCIGLRFGILQVKVGLTYLLRDYRFSLSEKTKSPLQMNIRSMMLSVVGGIWLNATKDV